jgi:hypothetical protein
MTAAWPAGVPEYAEQDGWSLTPISNMNETEFESGASRMRQTSPTVVSAVTEKLHFNAAQLQAFETWWRDTLGRGVQAFTKKVYTISGYAPRKCRFTGSHYTVTPRGAEFDVSLSLRVFNR